MADPALNAANKRITELEAERDQAVADAAGLKTEMEAVFTCANGIMPLYKDSADLRQTIIAANDARWTRLFAIWETARQALSAPAKD